MVCHCVMFLTMDTGSCSRQMGRQGYSYIPQTLLYCTTPIVVAFKWKVSCTLNLLYISLTGSHVSSETVSGEIIFMDILNDLGNQMEVLLLFFNIKKERKKTIMHRHMLFTLWIGEI